jgi:hypothetical protein
MAAAAKAEQRSVEVTAKATVAEGIQDAKMEEVVILDRSGNHLDGIAHNLDNETASPGKKRRNTEVSTLIGGSHAAVANTLWAISFSFLAHNHVHQHVVVDALVWFGQDNKFLQFLG